MSTEEIKLNAIASFKNLTIKCGEFTTALEYMRNASSEVTLSDRNKFMDDPEWSDSIIQCIGAIDKVSEFIEKNP